MTLPFQTRKNSFFCRFASKTNRILFCNESGWMTTEDAHAT